jgi:hypothetical protein
MSTSPWTAGTMVTIALNHDQFNGGKGCGTCIMYRGLGGGVGVTPLSTTQWTMGIVNNQVSERGEAAGRGREGTRRDRTLPAHTHTSPLPSPPSQCPECEKGSIDQNINGDGRWRVEWFAVPCNVGDSKIRYSRISTLGPEYWALVVSNTRVPVASVQIKVDGAWHTPHYTTNNQWVWPGQSVNRKWNDATDFPMPIRVTSVTGDVIEDVIPAGGNGFGAKQFKAVGGNVFESQTLPGYGKRANNYAAFVHPPVPAGMTMFKPETPAEATGTEANTGKTYKVATIYVKDGEQCGGMAGACQPRDVGQPTKPCIASKWPLAVCANADSVCLPSEGEGNFGNAKDAKFFRCAPKGGGSASGDATGVSIASSAASSTASPAVATGGRRLLLDA